MADNFKIGAGISLDGEAEFKKAVSGINKDLSVLGSEMKAVTAKFADNADSMEALTAKQDVFNRRADEQKKKIDTITQALEESKKEYGENSDQVKNWQIKLNNAEADLAKTESSIKKTTDQINNLGKEADDSGNSIKKLGNSQAEANKSSAKFEDSQKRVNSSLNALKVSAVAATAAVGALFAGFVKSAQAADEINTLAKQTGLSTEEIQKFQYATELIDVPLDTLTGSMAKLTKNMATAQGGTGDAADAFKALGISITDQNGELRNNQDVFNDTINALGKMENETQRDAYAMQIFGKSAQDLNPLILGGADALKTLGNQAEEAGLILSQDSLDSLNSINDSIDTFKASVKAGGMAILSEFANPIKEALSKIDMSKIINGVTDFIHAIIDNKDIIVSTISAIAAGMLAWNVANIVQSVVTAMKAWQLATEGMTIAQKILNLVMAANPIGIVVTAVAALAAGLVVLWNTNDDFKEAVINAWNSLKETAENVFGAIADFFTVKIPKAFQTVIDFIKNEWQGLLLLILNPIAGAIKLLYDLNPKFKEWVDNLIAGFMNWVGSFKDIGTNMIKGLWQGISDAGAWLWDKISSFFGGIVDGIKDFFGIHSPSTVMAKMGGYLSEGLANGITDKAGLVTDAMSKLNKGISANANLTVSATGFNTATIPNTISSALQSGSITVQQYFTGKTPSPAENARQTKNSLRQLALQLG